MHVSKVSAPETKLHRIDPASPGRKIVRASQIDRQFGPAGACGFDVAAGGGFGQRHAQGRGDRPTCRAGLLPAPSCPASDKEEVRSRPTGTWRLCSADTSTTESLQGRKCA